MGVNVSVHVASCARARLSASASRSRSTRSGASASAPEIELVVADARVACGGIGGDDARIVTAAADDERTVRVIG